MVEFCAVREEGVEHRVGGPVREIASRDAEPEDFAGDIGPGARVVLLFDLDESADQAIGRRWTCSIPARPRTCRPTPRRGRPANVPESSGTGRGRGHGRQPGHVGCRVGEQDAKARLAEEPLVQHERGARVLARQWPADDVDGLGTLRHERKIEPPGPGAAISQVAVVGPDREIRPRGFVLRTAERAHQTAFGPRQVAVDSRRLDGLHRPGVGRTRAGGPPVGQVGTNDLADGRDPVCQGQGIAVALGQEQIAIGVDTSAEVEVGAGEKAEVVFREDTELKHRHRDGLQRPAHPNLGAAARPRGHGNVVGGNDALEPLVGPRGDGGAVGVGRRRIAAAVLRVRNRVARGAIGRDEVESRHHRRVRRERLDFGAGRRELRGEGVGEVGGQLLEPRVRDRIDLGLIAIHAARPLVGHDRRIESNHQTREQHHDHQDDHERDAALVRHSGLHETPHPFTFDAAHRYRSTKARLRRLTCVFSVFRTNCLVVRSTFRDRPESRIFTFRI